MPSVFVPCSRTSYAELLFAELLNLVALLIDCIILVADVVCNVPLVAVKTKFAYAYTQEFPYRITHILECEFFLLEAMVSD